MSRKVAFGLVLVLALSASLPAVEAVCCSRKPDFGCCGNGACNIFCCNCDNGCNVQCENTNCDTGDWFTCAGIVTLCAAACVVTEGEACVDCMGPSYDTCAKCYASARRRSLLEVSGDAGGCAVETANRDAFFEEVKNVTGAPQPDGIAYLHFEAYVKQIAADEADSGMGGPATTLISSGLHAIIAEFGKLDSDGSGFIDRREFGF